MDGWTGGQKISPFYWTLSPNGAALLPLKKQRIFLKIIKSIEQGKGTAGYLMPLGDWLLDLSRDVSI